MIIPLMRKKFVEQYHWIEEDEILDLTAISQSAPGSMAVNASILIGYRLAGVPGAAVTILGTVLPPFLLLSVISLFYVAFEQNTIVKAVLKGMQSGVSAVIVDVVISMGADVVREKKILSDLIMLVVFAGTYFFNLNVIVTILVCGSLGAAVTIFRKRRKRE